MKTVPCGLQIFSSGDFHAALDALIAEHVFMLYFTERGLQNMNICQVNDEILKAADDVSLLKCQ